MPPPTSQDLALACLHRALDEEAFEHPWNVNILFQVTHLANPGPVHMPPIGGHKGTQLAQLAMQLEGNIDLNFSTMLIL